MNAPARPNRPPLFVHIIESPAPDDLFDGRTEGRTLCEALRLAEVPTWYRIASTNETFERSVGTDLVAAIQHYRATPLIHISAHGNQDGIQLTDGSFLSWDQLRGRLVPINQGLGGALILAMSSCFGAAGCRMAMSEQEDLPFHTLIGHMGAAAGSDAAVAFVAFYHRLFKGATLNVALRAMQEASGDNHFLVQHGARVQQDWTQYMQRVRLEELVRTLAAPNAAADQAGAPPSASPGA